MRWEKLPTTPPPGISSLYGVTTGQRASVSLDVKPIIMAELSSPGPGRWGGSYGPGRGTTLLYELSLDKSRVPGMCGQFSWYLPVPRPGPVGVSSFTMHLTSPLQRSCGMTVCSRTDIHPVLTHHLRCLPYVPASEVAHPDFRGPSKKLAHEVPAVRFCAHVWGRHGLCLGAAVSMGHVDSSLRVSPRLTGVTSEQA